MAGFFSLGGGSRSTTTPQDNQINPETERFLLYRNNEEDTARARASICYNKGFELWHELQQGQIHGQVQQQHPTLHDLYGGGLAMEVGPPSRGGYEEDDQIQNSRSAAALLMMGSSSTSASGGGSGTNTISCQDCGNQAKRDCVHMRCRTCCKTRGFPCQTHLKSTWVPAAKRRQRQLQLQHHQQQHLLHQQQHQQERENPGKRMREIPAPNSSLVVSTRGVPHNHNASGSGGMEVEPGNFPAEVSSPAVFRCVRVSSIGDAEDQYAYQTAVNIGGHVFKGILLDQGPETRYMPGERSSGSGTTATSSGLNLIGAAHSATVGLPVSVTPFLDPSLLPAPLNAFMSGTQFFPHQRS